MGAVERRLRRGFEASATAGELGGVRYAGFMGIEHVRYRRRVHPGDTVEIEAVVKRLRSRMGLLSGAARVNGQVVCNGTMTFALGPKTGSASE